MPGGKYTLMQQRKVEPEKKPIFPVYLALFFKHFITNTLVFNSLKGVTFYKNLNIMYLPFKSLLSEVPLGAEQLESKIYSPR